MRAKLPLVFSSTSLLVWALATFIGAFSLQAQSIPQAQVPPAAVASFQKAQPGITAQWLSGVQGSFEAVFTREGQSQVYVYDPAGLLQTKKLKTPMAQMPASVQSSVSAGYPDANVEAAYKVISRTQEKYYEVQVASASTRERLRYDLEGKPTGKVALSAKPSAPVASAPASKPAAPANAAVSKPVAAPATVAAATKPATPPASAPADSKPTTLSSSPAKPPIAMRGEAAPTTKPAVIEEEDDDLMDELEEEELLDEEEDESEWEDLDEEDDLLEEEDEEDFEELEDDDDDLG